MGNSLLYFCKGKIHWDKQVKNGSSDSNVFIKSIDYNMKSFLLLILLMPFLAFSQATVPCDKLTDKDHIKYFADDTKPFTGRCLVRYASGQPMMESPYVEGVLEGVETSWYENGQKKWEFTFKEGKFNGKIIFFYEDGKVKSEEVYVNDYKYGRAVHYYENGNKESEGMYDNCRETGIWLFYYPNGVKKEEGPFREGEKTGEWKYWDEKGNPVENKQE